MIDHLNTESITPISNVSSHESGQYKDLRDTFMSVAYEFFDDYLARISSQIQESEAAITDSGHHRFIVGCALNKLLLKTSYSILHDELNRQPSERKRWLEHCCNIYVDKFGSDHLIQTQEKPETDIYSTTANDPGDDVEDTSAEVKSRTEQLVAAWLHKEIFGAKERTFSYAVSMLPQEVSESLEEAISLEEDCLYVTGLLKKSPNAICRLILRATGRKEQIKSRDQLLKESMADYEEYLKNDEYYQEMCRRVRRWRNQAGSTYTSPRSSTTESAYFYGVYVDSKEVIDAFNASGVEVKFNTLLTLINSGDVVEARKFAKAIRVEFHPDRNPGVNPYLANTINAIVDNLIG